MEVLVVGADLEVHEHDPWVLHGVLDCPKECMLNSLATIDQTVIVSEGNVYIMVRITTWPFLTTGHAEDGRLGWVDDGSPKKEPNTPPLLMVKVPTSMSSIEIWLLAFLPSSAIPFSTSA